MKNILPSKTTYLFAQIKKNNLLFVKCFDKETPESESAIDIIDSLGKFITQH